MVHEEDRDVDRGPAPLRLGVEDDAPFRPSVAMQPVVISDLQLASAMSGVRGSSTPRRSAA